MGTVLWTRTAQAGTLLPGDLVRRNGLRHAVVASQLVPDEVRPAVDLVLRDSDGRDHVLTIDAYHPIAVLEVA